MLKVRIMGTENDIRWFHRVLMKHSEVDVLDASNLYSSKGTDRFYRAYLEVIRNRQSKERGEKNV